VHGGDDVREHRRLVARARTAMQPVEEKYFKTAFPKL
jgi:hypothetical protein